MDETRLDGEIASPADSTTRVPAPSNAAPELQPPDFTAAVQPAYAQTLLFDSDGLRPGWGFAFYGTSILFLLWVLKYVNGLTPLSRLKDLWSNLLVEYEVFVFAVLPAIVLARIERRRWSDFGLPLNRALGKLFWTGALWGFAGITLLMLAMSGVHVFHFGHFVLHGARMAKFGAYWAAMFLAVGLAEEFLFRGYVQFTLARGVGFWSAALGLSCAFGAIHWSNAGETFAGVLGAAGIAFFFCLTLRRTGNLWFAVGFHAAWDWGETFFYSVPDSGMVAQGHLLSSSFDGPNWLTGGSVGPEASVFCFVVIAALWLAFDRLYPRARI